MRLSSALSLLITMTLTKCREMYHYTTAVMNMVVPEKTMRENRTLHLGLGRQTFMKPWLKVTWLEIPQAYITTEAWLLSHQLSDLAKSRNKNQLTIQVAKRFWTCRTSVQVLYSWLFPDFPHKFCNRSQCRSWIPSHIFLSYTKILHQIRGNYPWLGPLESKWPLWNTGPQNFVAFHHHTTHPYQIGF